MSTSTSKLGDDFLRVPKLEVSGSNWVIFKDRFLWSLDARGILHHVDGTPAPKDPIPDSVRVSGTFSDLEKLLEIEWKKEWKEWKQGEAIAKQQIAGLIPDSLFMKIRAKETAREIWVELENHFQNRSRMVSVDLRRRLQDQKCPEKGDLVAHFTTLRTMREDLCAMGHPPADDDFYAIILGSLPPSFEPYISAVNATSSVLGKTLSVDDLMLTITEEYERRMLRAKGGKKDENVAFYSNDSGKGQKGGSSSKKDKNVECFNCHKKGHKKPDCWAPGGGKEGQGPNQKGKGKDKDKEKGKETAAATKENEKTEKKSGDDEAWMASTDSDSEGEEVGSSNFDSDFVDDLFENNSEAWFTESEELNEEASDDDLPPLQSVSDSDDESDSPNVDDDDDFLVCESPLIPLDDEANSSLEYAVLTETVGVKPTDVDLYDSGATRHMSGFRHRFLNFVEIEPKPISTADKRTFSATGKGDMYINVPNGDLPPSKILLKDVLYAPTMAVTLVSISRIAAAGSTVIFAGDACRIYDRERRVIGRIKVKGGLYRVYATRPLGGEYAGKTKEVLSLDELHRRLGHVSHERAKLLVEKGLVEGIELDVDSKSTICESCEWAKGERKAMAKIRERPRTSAVGDEVHSDLWGPAPVESIGHKRYYVSFTDDYSRYSTVYFLHAKSEAYTAYQYYEAWLKTQHDVRIKTLRSDRGGEYLTEDFSNHLKAAGTTRTLTVHDTPESNGVAERLNRTIITKVRAMLHDSELPHFLWAEATRHAVYLKNRTWTRTLGDTTPFEILTGRKPDLSKIHPWGCKVRVHDTSGSKLDGRSRIGRWVGLDEETSDGHRIYWQERRTITVERSVKFTFEEEVVVGVLPLEGENEPTVEQPTEPVVEPVVEQQTQPEIVSDEEELGRGKRIRKESEKVKMLRQGMGVTGQGSLLPKGIPETTDAAELTVEDFAMATVMAGAEGIEPTYQEARRRSDWPRWHEAIQVELQNLKTSGTWEIVKRPPNANVVDCRWVLRIKKNAAGEIEKYKARLVAKGFTQIYGVDYYETYAPVAKLASFRLLLALAARNGWPLDTFDFDSAYLNTYLNEDEVVYLEQPVGYETKDRRVWVWKLLKTLYGLKQGARNWYDALCRALKELGFTRTEADHGVFFRETGTHIVILAVHVDDCLVTGSSEKLVNAFKKEMNEKYKLTDLGPAHWLLGIKITRDLENKTISLSQHSYIDSIITRFNFNDLKPLSMPMDPSSPLSKTQSPTKLEDVAKMKNVPYREAVGSLMYAAMGTRPDIAFATSTVAQFSENPGWAHWEAVKRIFRYLLGTKKLELIYGGEKRGLVGYVDADGASQEHRRAITGYVFLVDGGAISWSSKKQELVTLSTTEAEYVAATHAAKEAIWLRRLIGELFKPVDSPTVLFSDSQSAIALAKDGHYHARTKHIDIRYHFIRYVIEEGTIKLIYCPTDDMTADTLTKALPSVKAKHFASALGLSTV
jgi:transposase InsO family protein